MPAMPHSAAGPRIEPPVSVPMPPRISPAATPAPVPLLDPAVKWSVFHGLRAGGQADRTTGRHRRIHASPSCRSARCRRRRAFRRRRHRLSGMLSCRIFEWQVVGMPVVSTMSLSPIGMPCSGPFGPSAMIAASAAAPRRARAPRSRWTKACSSIVQRVHAVEAGRVSSIGDKLLCGDQPAPPRRWSGCCRSWQVLLGEAVGQCASSAIRPRGLRTRSAIWAIPA